MKSCQESEAGKVLVNIYCKDCDEFHPQWRYLCDNDECFLGTINTSLGIDICPRCLGYNYLTEKQDERS
jgi:hypothetical protein